MSTTTVTDWLAEIPEDHRRILADLRELVLDTGPDIVESIKWGRPCYSADAGLFCYFHRSQNHVTIGLQHGGSLDDPDDILEGDGKEMRHVKIASHDDLDKSALQAMLKRAYSFNG